MEIKACIAFNWSADFVAGAIAAACLIVAVGSVASLPASAHQNSAGEVTLRDDTLQVNPAPIARFEDASALAAAPRGLIYVADAGMNAVIRISPATGAREALGGPGYDQGAFFEPLGVDPTNGQVLVVADAGNHRIQRFSDDFQFLEQLRVASSGGSYEKGRSSAAGISAARTPGRPIRVAAAPGGALYAIDAAGGVVIKWTPDRSIAWTIGGSEDVPDHMAQPVDVALSDDWLFVADRKREVILVYDHFGNYARQILLDADAVVQSAKARGAVEARGDRKSIRVHDNPSSVQALFIHKNNLYAVFPRSIRRYDVRGRLLDVWHVRGLGDSLVDAAVQNREFLLLTRKALYVEE